MYKFYLPFDDNNSEFSFQTYDEVSISRRFTTNLCVNTQTGILIAGNHRQSHL
ncbi:Uncharacterised protein [Klebsiella pneumoniae]|uniref:Uncharacterized protein n=1 Tax=Klebsiella pneumoniae TaxID=573 RepID=A0A377XIS3_KLEPN|nr:Uncharacterised protein [Klebsiella pneumoniae]